MNEIENFRKLGQAMAHPPTPWLDETITRREALEIAFYLIGCVLIPVVLFGLFR